MGFERDAVAMTQAMDGLRAALAITDGVHDWQTEWLDEREVQVYLSGRQVEARRLVARQQARVTVYNDHAPADGSAEPARGMATITLTSAELRDLARIAARVASCRGDGATDG